MKITMKVSLEVKYHICTRISSPFIVYVYYMYLQRWIFVLNKSSVSDPDPVGPVSFGQIRIHFSNMDPDAKINQNYKNMFFFGLIHMNNKLINYTKKNIFLSIISFTEKN